MLVATHLNGKVRVLLGVLITYMRMKNIVPPTSEPGFGQPPKK